MANQHVAETFSMKGKYCLVTGASSGLGAHFAKCYAKSGAAGIAVLARRAELLKELEAELRTLSPDAKVVSCQCDVTSRESVFKAFDAVEIVFGRPVDVVVNNAGAGGHAHFLNVADNQYDHMTNVNVRGCWYVAQEAAKRLVATKREGTIINIASILGLRVRATNSLYATTKAALVQMTKGMALDLAAHNIRANAICPGYYRTPMTEKAFEDGKPRPALIEKIPSKRVGLFHELDGALLLLSSNASSNMTGSVIAVDGGHLLSSL